MSQHDFCVEFKIYVALYMINRDYLRHFFIYICQNLAIELWLKCLIISHMNRAPEEDLESSCRVLWCVQAPCFVCSNFSHSK